MDWFEKFPDTPEPNIEYELRASPADEVLYDIKKDTEYHLGEAVEREFELSKPNPIAQHNVPRNRCNTGGNIIETIKSIFKHL